MDSFFEGFVFQVSEKLGGEGWLGDWVPRDYVLKRRNDDNLKVRQMPKLLFQIAHDLASKISNRRAFNLLPFLCKQLSQFDQRVIHIQQRPNQNKALWLFLLHLIN